MASTNSEDIVFKGVDGNECEAFVAAIRDLAFANGRQKDKDWMLDYATTRLRGKALRWHAKLDPSVQDSWHLFVQALFEEYPLVEKRDEAGIATPVWTATTFSPGHSVTTLPGNDALCTPTPDPQPCGKEATSLKDAQSQARGLQVGRLRIIYEQGEVGPQYISRGGQDSGGVHLKGVTMKIHEALIVSFVSSTSPHQIGCMNSTISGKWYLGVQLFPIDYPEFHPVIGKTLPATFKYNQGRGKPGDIFHTVSTVWNILTDGTLCATLAGWQDSVPKSKDSSTQILSESHSTTSAYVEIGGASISFVKDNITPQTLHPISGRSIVRARIVFESI